jgi:hypothetical protein
MARDPFDPLRSVAGTDALSRLAGASGADALTAFQSQAERLVVDYSDMLERSGANGARRALEQQQNALRDSMGGTSAADLARSLYPYPEFTDALRATTGADALTARAADRLQHDAFALLGASNAGLVAEHNALTRGLRAPSAFQTLLDSAADQIKAWTVSHGWNETLGRALAGVGGYRAFQEHAQAFVEMPESAGTMADLVRRYASGLDLAQPPRGKTAADTLTGFDAAALKRLTLDVGADLAARLPELGRATTFNDVRTAVGDLDVADLRDMLGRLAEALEDATGRAGGGERRSAHAQRRALQAQHKGIRLQAKANALAYVMLAMTMLAIIVDLLPHMLEKARAAPPTPPAAPTPRAPTKPSVRPRPAVVVKAKHAIMRAGPSTTQRALATLRADDILIVVGARFGWLQASFVDPTGDGSVLLGWVPARATSPIQVETVEALVCRLVQFDADAGHTAPDCRR